MSVVIAMVKIFAAMALGFFLYKKKILNDEANERLSKLVLFVTGNVTTLVAVLSTDISEKQNVFKLLIIGCCCYAVLIPLGFVITKLFRFGRGQKSDGVYQAMLIFGNTGFLGIPLGEALYGQIGIFYMAILNAILGIFFFSYGMFIITKGSGSTYRFTMKSFINPGLITVIVSFVLYFLNVRFPDIVMLPLEFIHQLTSPLAMVVLGSMIGAYSFKRIFSKWQCYVISAIKLLVIPLATFFILKATIGTGLITSCITIMAGMPTAVIVSMMSLTYDSDYETASLGTGMMNIFCVVTIPILYFIINGLS